ncbi:hypothetical protein PLESTM_001938700 [Pleodorina starrii]|nr:hypothetical protein PLESTM_001938700 [Pleodorina starrii]
MAIPIPTSNAAVPAPQPTAAAPAPFTSPLVPASALVGPSMALPTPEPDPLPAPRGQPQQPPPNISRIDAQLPASSAFMRGLSDLDVILSRGPNDNAAAAIGNTLQHPELLQRLLDGGSVAVPRDTRPEHFANDYDPRWFLFTHPEVFPNGTGACPKGMSLDAWGQLLLRRWYPFDDPGISPYFLIDLYDVWVRHEVSRMTYVKLQLTSASTIESIGTLTYEETAQVINLLRHGLMGAALSTELAKLPQGARHLFECFKFVNGRVRGTPWVFRSLRAHYLGGAWLAWGPPTMSLNLNPSPLDSHIVFYLAGRPYKFSRDGVPEGRPDIVQRWRHRHAGHRHAVGSAPHATTRRQHAPRLPVRSAFAFLDARGHPVAGAALATRRQPGREGGRRTNVRQTRQARARNSS